MKKIFLILLGTLIILTGCAKTSDKTVKNNFLKNIKNLKNYYMEGEMTLTNNDDTYKYDVKISYKEKDYYKVELNNKSNNYQQIIIRNDEGVFVYTPSLNKSFKFQSEWPYNNSQVYILKSLANDLENDRESEFKKVNKDYIFTTKVYYPNNQKLVKQNITLDDDYKLEKVEVLDKNNISLITFVVKKIDENPTFNDDYFILKETNNKNEKNELKEENKETNSNNNASKNTEEETINIEESLFPMYLPENTMLSNKETINTEDGKRIIMTFSGEKPFILVEETVNKEEELTIVPTYGEPYLLIDTVGSLTDISYTWTSNNIEYYIVSDVLEQNELLEIAKSIGVIATINEK